MSDDDSREATPEPTRQLPDLSSLSLADTSSKPAGGGGGGPPPPPPPPAGIPSAPSAPFSLGGTPYRKPGEKTGSGGISAGAEDSTKPAANKPKGPDGFVDALQTHINSWKSVQDKVVRENVRLPSIFALARMAPQHKEEKLKEFEQDQFTNLPSQLMMTAAKADKKPFTYTPVGLTASDLKAPSTLRREKLAKSSMGNYAGGGYGSGYESSDETPIQRATSLTKLNRATSAFGVRSDDEATNGNYGTTGVNPALQSRSFKILQARTGGDDYGAQTDTESSQNANRPQLERRGSQPFNDHASTWRPAQQQQVIQPTQRPPPSPRGASNTQHYQMVPQLITAAPRSPLAASTPPPQMYRTTSSTAPGDPSRVVTSYTPVSQSTNVHGNSEDWSPYQNLTDDSAQNLRYQGSEIPSKIFRYLQTQVPATPAATNNTYSQQQQQPQQYQQQQQQQHQPQQYAASQRLGGYDCHMSKPSYHAPTQTGNSNSALAERVNFSNQPARHFGGGVMDNLQKYFGADSSPATGGYAGDATPREVSRVTSFGPNGEQRITTTYAYGTPGGSEPCGTYTNVEETSSNCASPSNNNARTYSTASSTMSSHGGSSRGSDFGDFNGNGGGNNWQSRPVGNTGMISTVTKIVPTRTWPQQQQPQQRQQPPTYYNGQQQHHSTPTYYGQQQQSDF